jgi:UDP-N-acetylglucosamine--N-acetylmuramyl-(pentapeptide) pyrophosphoryl-undecaprenol N-acetylglucosamine transferase
MISLIRSFIIVRKFKPDVAIGVGGYASGPLLYAAAKKGVPTVIQEQNSYPGITNKLLAKRASKICVAYDGLDRFFANDKIIKTGNPVRKEISEMTMEQIAAKEYFGFERDRSLILVIGGSLGARTLNESLFNGLDKIKDESVQLLWQCGKLYFDEFNNQLNKDKFKNVQLTKFITEMDKAYAAADLIISRAGALSISELCLIGKPVILVPSPNVSEDHQTKNAMALVDNNAAVMVKDVDAREDLVVDAIKLLRNKNKMEELGINIKKMAFPNATEQIVQEIIKIIKA